MDDDTGVEAGVTLGSRPGPDVHAHTRLLAIRRSGKVGVVGSRAVLGVQDNIVVATATSAVVVDLEVTSSLVEAESVKQVVVGVCNVEELGDGSVYVGRWRAGGGGVGEHVVVAAATTGPVVVQVGSSTGRVRLSNGIVTTGHSVGRRAGAVPAELGSCGVPRVGKGCPAAFARVVDSPGAVFLLVKLEITRRLLNLLDLVGSISGPVDHSVDLLLGVGIDVSQKPVAQDISLDAESKLELTILLKVHELGLGVLLCTLGSLENVRVIALCRLGGCVVCLNRELKNADSALESLHGLDQVALAELRWFRDLSLVERTTEREDGAILVDLWTISIRFLEAACEFNLR